MKPVTVCMCMNVVLIDNGYENTLVFISPV